MSWNRIKLIFLREVRDQLRDRRTLFMIAVLPLLLYPALGIGMLQMTMMFREQKQTVVVLGADQLPPPLLIAGDQFVNSWFVLPEDAEKLLVITDLHASDSERQTDETNLLLQQAREIKKVSNEGIALELQYQQALQNENTAVSEVLRADIVAVSEKLNQLFSESTMQVLVLIPDDFGENVKEVNQLLATGQLKAGEAPKFDKPFALQNSAYEKSDIAYKRVASVMNAWEKELLKLRFDQADLPESIHRPVNFTSIDLASDEQISANLWSRLFPALLVIMAVTGAFYPAVDLCAGEKERGTMETLLICPASRMELVMGKFFTVMVFSIATAVLNLMSMGFTGKYMVSMAGAGPMSRIGEVAFPSGMALFWTLVLLIPLAALFSALCLALATFARSSKEGQYYLTPLLMVTMGLTVFCMSPAVEIEPFYSVMPIINVSLLLKGLLLAPVSSGSLYLYIIPVLVTSIGYSLLALWWAIELFKREDVLFLEAERFEIGLWFKHLFRDKEATPSFTEAGFCFVMIMFLQFGAMKFFGQALGEGDRSVQMLRLLIIQQLVIIACPALFMGVMLTTSVVRTFQIKLPNLKFLGAAIALPLVLNPLSLELAHNLSWFFPPLPDGVREAIASMSNPNMPLWLLLLAFAVAPAICEETAFRGFILSGFRHSKHTWLAIVLSSVTFGVMHMIPQQVFNATLVGLVLGLIAVRSGSIIPCIVFHFIFNSSEVLKSRLIKPDFTGNWLFQVQGEELRYTWPVLVVSAGVAFVLLRWLVRYNDQGSTNLNSQSADISAETVVSASLTGKQSSLGTH